MSGIFPWYSDIVFETYRTKSNYKIVSTGKKTNKTIIFFSGNGLYYPNDENIFRETINNKDRYEWDRIGKSKRFLKEYEKIIYIRDIYKQWYVKGINSQLDTPEAVIEWLKKETYGQEITCVGCSAGGYAALLFGLHIGANIIIDISGQHNLNILKKEENPFLYNNNGTYYWDLREIINQYNSSNIYYFYPRWSSKDMEEYELLKDFELHKFAVDSGVHGSLFRGDVFPYLLTSDNIKLSLFEKKYKEKIITNEDAFRFFVPAMNRVYLRLRHQIGRIFEKKMISV